MYKIKYSIDFESMAETFKESQHEMMICKHFQLKFSEFFLFIWFFLKQAFKEHESEPYRVRIKYIYLPLGDWDLQKLVKMPRSAMS